MGHLAAELPRRQAPRNRRLEHRSEGRRRLALGDLPGASLRGLRPLHGPGRGLVLAHLHGLRRVWLRPVHDAAHAGRRLPGLRQLPAGGHRRRLRQAARDPERDLHLRARHRRPGMAALRGLRPDAGGADAGRGPTGDRARDPHRLRGRQLRLPDRLPPEPERPDQPDDRRHRPRRGQGRRRDVDERPDRRGGHRVRHADRAEPRRGEPRPLLQLPHRLRRRPAGQPLRHHGHRRRRGRARRAPPVALEGRGDHAALRARGALPDQRDGAARCSTSPTRTARAISATRRAG